MKYGRILTLLALVAFVTALAAPAQAARSRSTRRSSTASVKPTPTPKATETPAETKSGVVAAPATKTPNAADQPADTAKPPKTEETPKPEKPSKPAGVAASADTNSMFAGTNIKLKVLRADDIEIDPNPTTGTTTLLGNVYIETDQFILKGETVRKTGQVIRATGNLVYIEMPGSNGNTNKATAKRVTYNLETRKMLLEGDPVVTQEDPEKTVVSKADAIEYNQSDSGVGAIHFKKLPRSNRQPEMKAFYKNAAETPKATPSPRKINSGNSSIINIPPPDIGG